MQVILGILYHSIGGFASGSFYMPYNWVKKWRWEIYWITGGIFSWLIVPYLAVRLTIPGYQEILSVSTGSVLRTTYIMGLLWGVGGLTYGLAIRYLGMSLGNSVLLGITSVVGSLGLPIIRNIPGVNQYIPEGISFTDLLGSTGGLLVLFGVLICVVGIILCGRAGLQKDKDLGGAKDGVNTEFSLSKGLIIAIVSGVLSAFFSFGIDAGKPMAEIANNNWLAMNPGGSGNYIFQNNITFFVILWGGLTTNVLWTGYLILKNRTYGDFTDKSTPLTRNYLFCILAGTMWFMQFFFYGMGETKIGNGASSWILHMSTIILTSNLWGFYRREWKGVSKKTYFTILMGIFAILLAVIVVGAAKWLYPELNALG
ncbi:L-rhamnose-H+ transport protein [Mariniphaga anaerophila]|uniref:L-rhamnose-H+ transport protein n=1 Tax=Mariniphaga anaerophila TaxID=1484053 RepID=A0A1M5ARX9_9BACT|nr:L-rhamnose/proton symporter RhaT [Mariniphaga anaerophila]SHF32990.1 L-rhamnose-H+ transport protein [Mariniphaga anaerophila]